MPGIGLGAWVTSVNKTDQKFMPFWSSCSTVNPWQRPTCLPGMCILHLFGAVVLNMIIKSRFLLLLLELCTSLLTFFPCLLYQFLRELMLKFPGVFVNSSTSVFNYHQRRHILLKDKNTDFQNKKHILSHKVRKNGGRIPN